MTIPYRGRTSNSTYFITSSTDQKKRLLQSERMAQLLIEVLYDYRKQQKYLLHEFVVMPHHFHMLVTPCAATTLERSLQFIKGGFSHHAHHQFGTSGQIWQTSFHDRRVRDEQEYLGFREYIHQNPVKAGLAATAEEYPYSSAKPGFELDAVPQRLKPGSIWAFNGGLKASSTR